MISLPSIKMPRPKTFLGFMSLRSGAELISLTILINKVSGFYGLLAIATGLELSHTQLSMYLYSVAASILTLYLYSSIRTGDPLQCLTLAFFYVLDSLINAAYTVAFGVAWFLVLAEHPDHKAQAPGKDMINDTAGFTSPEHNVSEVDVIAAPKPGLQIGQDTVTIGKGSPSDEPAGLGNALFQSGSIMSITFIAGLWLVRLYFIIIMLAYARTTLRQYIATTSSTAAWQAPTPAALATDTKSTTLAENPFAEHREEGLGWKGKLGRTMLKVGPAYWLGADDEETAWTRSVGTRFTRHSRKHNLSVETTSSMASQGTMERERRRRSGTGPPAPPPMPPFITTVEPRS